MESITVEQIAHIVFYEDNIPKYDDLYQYGVNVTDFHPASRIRHTYYKAIWPASKRDFSVLFGFVKLEVNLCENL